MSLSPKTFHCFSNITQKIGSILSRVFSIFIIAIATINVRVSSGKMRNE